jgi:segregation and condensation protein A
LFDLLRLHRIRPWDVNVTFLLNSFLAEMKKRGRIDFSASGTALLSSAIIHKMKSELILKMEDPPKPPAPRPKETVPPPLPIPIRYEHLSISIEQVLKALEEVLESERLTLTREKKPILEQPQVIQQLDEFLTNIESYIREFHSFLVESSKRLKTISFTKLVRGLPTREVIRRFIMLLFLACEGKVKLFQKEELGDIQISVLKVA